MAKDKRRLSSKSSPKKFGEFTLLTLLCGPSKVPHIMYIRKHVSKTQSLGEITARNTLVNASSNSMNSSMEYPEGKTLFVVNIPVDATFSLIRAFFAPAGPITDVYFQKADSESTSTNKEDSLSTMKITNDGEEIVPAPIVIDRNILPTGSSAHIIFLEQEGLERVFTHLSKQSWPPMVENTKPLGLDRYNRIYQNAHPDSKLLQSHVDTFMQAFAAEELKRKEKFKLQKANVPDEEGFVTVTRGNSGRGGVGGTGVRMQDAKVALEREKEKKKKGQLQDFYRFQLRQRKRDELAELRHKFNQDKERIAKLRENRKFKPY